MRISFYSKFSFLALTMTILLVALWGMNNLTHQVLETGIGRAMRETEQGSSLTEGMREALAAIKEAVAKETLLLDEVSQIASGTSSYQLPAFQTAISHLQALQKVQSQKQFYQELDTQIMKDRFDMLASLEELAAIVDAGNISSENLGRIQKVAIEANERIASFINRYHLLSPDVQQLIEEMVVVHKQNHTLIEQLKSSSTGRYDNLQQQARELLNLALTHFASVQQVISRTLEDQIIQETTLRAEIQQALSRMDRDINAIASATKAEVARSLGTVKQVQESQHNVMTFLTIVAMSLVLLLTVWLRRTMEGIHGLVKGISLRMRKTRGVAQEVAIVAKEQIYNLCQQSISLREKLEYLPDTQNDYLGGQAAMARLDEARQDIQGSIKDSQESLQSAEAQTQEVSQINQNLFQSISSLEERFTQINQVFNRIIERKDFLFAKDSHGTADEFQSIIGQVQTLFQKSRNLLDKYASQTSEQGRFAQEMDQQLVHLGDVFKQIDQITAQHVGRDLSLAVAVRELGNELVKILSLNSRDISRMREDVELIDELTVQTEILDELLENVVTITDVYGQEEAYEVESSSLPPAKQVHGQQSQEPSNPHMHIYFDHLFNRLQSKQNVPTK
jgi:hypothetical protein